MKHEELPHHMRMAALQCGFEEGEAGTFRIPDLWKEFGFNVEQLFHTHGELYSAVFDKDKHGALLEKYLKETRKHGIRVIIYMNCHILLPSDETQLSSWAQIGREGDLNRLYETYYVPCLNSSWREVFKGSIANLQAYDINGIFLDGPSPFACFCDCCKARYSELHGGNLLDADPEDMSRFVTESKIDFLADIYRTVKQVNPRWVCYMNAHLLNSAFTVDQMRRILDCNDIVGTEGGFQFYGQPSNTPVWRSGLHGRLVEAVAGNKPRVIFMAGDHKPWSWYLHTEEETKLCYASILANGCSVWYGIHCDSRSLQSPAGEAAKEMVRFDKAHDGLYQQTRSMADVAVFYSFETAKRYVSRDEASDFYQTSGSGGRGIGNYIDSFYGAVESLFRSSIAFDLVTDLNLENLRKYKVLLMPTTACMDERMGNAVRSFVEEGGTILADSELSLYDEAMNRRNDFLLSDVIGAHFEGMLKYNDFDYFMPGPEFNLIRGEGVRYVPAPRVALKVRCEEETDILGRLCPPLSGRYSGKPEDAVHPFLLAREYGKGRVYYAAGTFFERYRGFGIPHYREIVESIVRNHSEPMVELTGDPSSVEFTVRESVPEGVILVHIVNYSGGTMRPLERVQEVRDLRLKVRCSVSGAKTLVGQQTLSVGDDGVIALPPVKTFEVVVIERI